MASVSGARLQTWRERENNKQRERRRRAITAKIYAGLRTFGSFKLPKHCDNNEVLKALCREAGWIVEDDGTTYPEGCKPPEQTQVVGGSASQSPCSSRQPSPCTSYNPSPGSSALPSPRTPSCIATANTSSVLPWLKNLPPNPSFASSSKLPELPEHEHVYIFGTSISAPITPALASPTGSATHPEAQPWNDSSNYASMSSSPPASPRRPAVPVPKWLTGIQIPTGAPASPTFSFVSTNPFFCNNASGAGPSRMWTQSGASSPVAPGAPGGGADAQMSEGGSDEFAFGNVAVNPWEGERIHEGSEELELTLGSAANRGGAA